MAVDNPRRIHTLCKDGDGNDYYIDLDAPSVIPKGHTLQEAKSWIAKMGKTLDKFTDEDWEAIGVTPSRS